MRQVLTSAAAIALAAGMASAALAQTMTTPATPGATSPGMQSTHGMQSTNGMQSMAPAGPNSTAAGQATGDMNSQPGMQSENQSSSNDSSTHHITQAQIRGAQEQLKAQGLYRGQVDGIVGQETHAAIVHYQRQHGLRQTATLDANTLKRLTGNQTSGFGSSTPPDNSAAPLGAGGNNTGVNGGTAKSPANTGINQPIQH